jgi:hypothetical protein
LLKRHGEDGLLDAFVHVVPQAGLLAADLLKGEFTA